MPTCRCWGQRDNHRPHRAAHLHLFAAAGGLVIVAAVDFHLPFTNAHNQFVTVDTGHVLRANVSDDTLAGLDD